MAAVETRERACRIAAEPAASSTIFMIAPPCTYPQGLASSGIIWRACTTCDSRTGLDVSLGLVLSGVIASSRSILPAVARIVPRARARGASRYQVDCTLGPATRMDQGSRDGVGRDRAGHGCLRPPGRRR